MVENKNLPSVPGPEKARVAGHLTLDFDEGSFTLTCDLLAHGEDDTQRLLLFSGVGSSTEVRAIRAGLWVSNSRKTSYAWKPVGSYTRHLPRSEDGYEVWVAPLGPNTHHILAISKEDSFIHDTRPPAVFKKLSARTTTPIHKDWAEWLTLKLRQEMLLQNVNCYGLLKAGLLVAHNEQLDKIVTQGLRQGAIRIAV